MKQEVRKSERRIVVITDPHIKVDNYYKTYKVGLKLDSNHD